MRDNTIHGKIEGANTPQTYCGITPFGHKISSTPVSWTCAGCISVYNKTHPDKPIIKEKSNVDQPVQPADQPDPGRSQQSSNQVTANGVKHKTRKGPRDKRIKRTVEPAGRENQNPV